MKTQDKEITAEEFFTQDKIDKLQFNTDDNNGIIDEDYIINLMEEYVKANEKELLEKAFEAGGDYKMKPLTTDLIDQECPNFETWYNQLKNQKDNG